MSLSTRVKALLGVSAYSKAPITALSIADASVEDVRKERGGQLTNQPTTRTRWLMSDLESAQVDADRGWLQPAAQLWNSVKTDGVFMGIASTRTAGLVRLPKRFRGDQKWIEELEAGHDSVRSVFDEMFPPNELTKMALDGLGLGVSIGELVPVTGRDYPVLVTHNPEWLSYRYSENRWYLQSIAGQLPITPGDGRWVLHCPGGRVNPWREGLWRSIAKAFINKSHAEHHDQLWQASLANPLVVGINPQGATSTSIFEFVKQLAAWSVRSILAIKPGWDVKLVESNGRGHEAFKETIERAEKEYTLCINGQVVTVDGGAGFQNSDIHKSVRADLIQATADDLAYTLNTQGIPPWLLAKYDSEDEGIAALDTCPTMHWDVTPPKDRAAEAQALLTATTAIQKAVEVAKAHGLTPTKNSVKDALYGLGLVFEDSPSNSTPVAKLTLAPTDVAKVVRVDEARESQGLPPVGDERGQLMIVELDTKQSGEQIANAPEQAEQAAKQTEAKPKAPKPEKKPQETDEDGGE